MSQAFKIREAAALVTNVVSSIASAASIGALATLITGIFDPDRSRRSQHGPAGL